MLLRLAQGELSPWMCRSRSKGRSRKWEQNCLQWLSSLWTLLTVLEVSFQSKHWDGSSFPSQNPEPHWGCSYQGLLVTARGWQQLWGVPRDSCHALVTMFYFYMAKNTPCASYKRSLISPVVCAPCSHILLTSVQPADVKLAFTPYPVLGAAGREDKPQGGVCVKTMLA